MTKTEKTKRKEASESINYKNYLGAKYYMEDAINSLNKALDYGAPPAIEDEILPLLKEQVKIMNNLDRDDINELFYENKAKKLVEV